MLHSILPLAYRRALDSNPWVIEPINGGKSRLIDGWRIARNLRLDGIVYSSHVGDDLIFDLSPKQLFDRMTDKYYRCEFIADFNSWDFDEFAVLFEGLTVTCITFTSRGVVMEFDNGYSLLMCGELIPSTDASNGFSASVIDPVRLCDKGAKFHMHHGEVDKYCKMMEYYGNLEEEQRSRVDALSDSNDPVTNIPIRKPFNCR